MTAATCCAGETSWSSSLRYPNPELRGRTFIKRIVGLPNEDLRLDDGLVYVDGELLKETYLDQPSDPKAQHSA